MANLPPIYTAQGVNVRPRTPGHISAPESGLAEAGAGLQHLGQTAAEHIGYLQNQKDSIDFQFARSRFDTSLINLKQDLQNDPDIYDNPDAYVKKFGERARDIITEIGQDSKASAYSQALFRNYAAIKLPEQLVHAKAEGHVLFAKNEVKRLDNLKEVMSDDAVNAETPADKYQITKAFEEEVTKASPRSIDPAQAADKIHDFVELVADKSGRKLANGSSDQREQWRELVRMGKTGIKNTDTIYKISDMARIKEEHEDRKTKQVIHEASQYIYHGLFSTALYGETPQSVLDSIQRHENPLITPEQGHRLQEIQDNAPMGGTSWSVRAIIADIETRPGGLTKSRVEEAKTRLRQLAETNGRATKDMTTAIEHYSSLALQMDSIANIQTNKALDYGRNVYNASKPPTPPFSFLEHIERNNKIVEQAEIDKRIRATPGITQEGAAKIVDDVRKEKKTKFDQRTQGDKDLDVLKGTDR